MRIALLFGLTLLVGAPLGYAGAQIVEGGDEPSAEVIAGGGIAEGGFTGEKPLPEGDEPTSVSVPPESTGEGSIGESYNELTQPTAEQVENCKKDPNWAPVPGCDALIAIDAGKMEPGRYSDAELAAAVEEAHDEGK